MLKLTGRDVNLPLKTLDFRLANTSIAKSVASVCYFSSHGCRHMFRELCDQLTSLLSTPSPPEVTQASRGDVMPGFGHWECPLTDIVDSRLTLMASVLRLSMISLSSSRL